MPSIAGSVAPQRQGCASRNDGVEDDEPGCSGFTSRVAFPGLLRKAVTGRLREIEARHGATIKLAQGGANELLVSCDTPHSLNSTEASLREVIASSRSRADFTHFISLPLHHPVGPADPRNAVSLAQRAATLRSDVDHLVAGKHRWQDGLHHITLLMLRLLDDAEVARAAEVLRGAGPLLYDAVGTRCLVPRVQGLCILPGQTPDKARVLAASVAEPEVGVIRRVHEVIVKAFREGGLLESEKQADPLVVHVTLMRGDPTVDVTEVLQKKGSFDFGAHRIPAIHLSKRRQFGPDGYYHCEAKVDLP